MTVDQLAGYVKQYWPILKARLLAGEYHPQGVRAVESPNPKVEHGNWVFPASWIA